MREVATQENPAARQDAGRARISACKSGPPIAVPARPFDNALHGCEDKKSRSERIGDISINAKGETSLSVKRTIPNDKSLPYSARSLPLLLLSFRPSRAVPCRRPRRRGHSAIPWSWPGWRSSRTGSSG